MATGAFETYYAELRSKLQSKRSPITSKGASMGQVFLLFPGALGDKPGRISVLLDEVQGAQVSQSMDQDAPRSATVRATLEDWLRYCESPSPDTIARLELYGDLQLLGTLGSLMKSRRSAIDTRAMPSPSPTRRRRR